MQRLVTAVLPCRLRAHQASALTPVPASPQQVHGQVKLLAMLQRHPLLPPAACGLQFQQANRLAYLLKGDLEALLLAAEGLLAWAPLLQSPQREKQDQLDQLVHQARAGIASLRTQQQQAWSMQHLAVPAEAAACVLPVMQWPLRQRWQQWKRAVGCHPGRHQRRCLQPLQQLVAARTCAKCQQQAARMAAAGWASRLQRMQHL